MKQTVVIFSIFLLGVAGVSGQQKMTGVRYGSHHYFNRDTDTLVTKFGSDGWAAFKIKRKSIFKPEDDRVGFIDTSGLMVIKPNYSDCSFFRGGFALVRGVTHERKYGLIDRAGKIIIPIEYTQLERCLNGLFLIGKGDKIGFINTKGQIIIPPEKYSWVERGKIIRNYNDADDSHVDGFNTLPYYEDIAFKNYIGVGVNYKWGAIDSTGREIIPLKFDGIGLFKGVLAPVTVAGKYGVTDTSGNMVIPAFYDHIELFNNSFVAATQGKKTGVLSRDNKLLVPITHDNIKQIANDAFLVIDNGRCGVINIKNRVVIPIQYINVMRFKKGYIGDDPRKYQTLFDDEGNRLCDLARNESNNTYCWGNNEVGFFIYNQLDEKFHRYQKIIEYQKMVEKKLQLFYYRNKKWGLIDTTGREKTAAIFDKVRYEDLDGLENFEVELIFVKKNNKWGIITKQGKMLSGFEYDDISPGYDDYVGLYHHARIFLIVRQGSTYGLLNKALLRITPIKYDSIVMTPYLISDHKTVASYVSIQARLDKKWALLNNDGKEITPFKYDNYFLLNVNNHALHDSFFIVKKGDKFGTINFYGKELTKFKFASYSTYHHLTIVKSANKCGVVSAKGKQIANCIYNEINLYESGFVAKKGNEFGAFDLNGKLIIPFTHAQISYKNAKFFKVL